jgi:hypothetical protein
MKIVYASIVSPDPSQVFSKGSERLRDLAKKFREACSWMNHWTMNQASSLDRHAGIQTSAPPGESMFAA